MQQDLNVKIKMKNTYIFYIEESNDEITELTFRRSQVNLERLSMAFKVRQLHNSETFIAK